MQEEKFIHNSIVPYQTNPDGTETSYYPAQFESSEPDFDRTLAITTRGGRTLKEEIIDKPWSYFCEGH